MRTILVLLLLLLPTTLVAQTQSQAARKVISGAGVPNAPCIPGPIWRDVYIRTTTGVWYHCTAAPNTWTVITNPASISGTDTRILFFDGDNTPAGDAGITYNKTTDTLTVVGSIVSGSGSGVAGALDLAEGTAPPLVANTISEWAPVDVAAGGIGIVKLGAAGTGYRFLTNSSNVMTESLVSNVSLTIASGTSALGTSAIASGACATVVTTTATGTATTDTIGWGFNGDPTGVTGYQASANGMLTIIAYPSANNVNFKVCNNLASSVTPGAITLNWRVIR